MKMLALDRFHFILYHIYDDKKIYCVEIKSKKQWRKSFSVAENINMDNAEDVKRHNTYFARQSSL